MRRRHDCFGAPILLGAVMVILAGGLAQSARAAEWRMLGAGTQKFAWVVTPMEIPTGGVNDERVWRGQTHLFSAEKKLGAALVMRAHSVVEPPLFMTGHNDRLVFIYEARAGATDSEPSGLRKHSIRSMRIFTTEAGTIFVDPPDRYAVEPPLTTTGALIDAADTAFGLAALERNGEGATIHLLDRRGWRVLSTPEGAAWPMKLIARQRDVGLLADGPAGATLWTLSDPEGMWTPSPVDETAIQSEALWTPGGLIAWTFHEASGQLSFELVLKDRVTPLATVEGVAADHAVARLGENILVVWMDDAEPSRMRMAIVSSITGQTLYDDYANFGPALTPADLRVVAFLLSAVMLGVLLFVLKPETPEQATPPKGWVVADLTRRFFAAAIDASTAAIASAAIWGVPIDETIDPSYLLLMSDGDTWPVLTVMGIYFAHGAIAEWLFGRTLGKAALRCRTHSTRGERMRLWQSCARNLVKVIVPPLVALVLFEPTRRHPGDLLGGTLVVAPGESDEDDDDEAPGDTQGSGED